MTDKVYRLLLKQIVREMYSMYLYKGMGIYFSMDSLEGFAAWANKSSGEEQVHANKVIDHLVDRDMTVELGLIDFVPTSYQSPKAAFEAAYKHEQSISVDWLAIAEASLSVGDYATFGFAQGFVAEQVEEERKVLDVLQLFEADNNILLVEHIVKDRLD